MDKRRNSKFGVSVVALLLSVALSSSNGQTTRAGSESVISATIGVVELQGAAGGLFRNFEVSCTAVALGVNVLRCSAGHLSGKFGNVDTISGTFQVDYTPGKQRYEIDAHASSGMQVNAVLSGSAAGWSVNAALDNLELASLRFVLPVALWPAVLSDERGRVSLSLQASGEDSGSMRSSGEISFRGVGFDGTHVAEDIDADVEYTIARRAGLWSGESVVHLTNGITYFEPGFTVNGGVPGFTIEVLGEPISLELAAEWDPQNSHLNIKQADFNHPGIGRFSGELIAWLGDTPGVERVTGLVNGANLSGLYATYLQPMLLGTGFARLEAVGLLSGEVEWQDQRLRHLRVQFNDTHVYDDGERFQLAELNGGFEFTGAEQTVYSDLSWGGGAIYRIDFGSGQVGFESSASRVKLSKWSDVSILDGALQVASLSLEHVKGYDFEWTVAGALTPVSMQALTHALGWPIMSG